MSDETTSGPASSRRKGLSNRAKLLLSPLIVLLALELVARLYVRVTDEPYDSAATREHIEHTVAAMSPYSDDGEDDDIVPHPYFGWERANNLATTFQDEHYFTTEEADTSFDVLVVGSSVGASVTNRAGDRLVQMLSADARLTGRPVRLMKYARAAFKQPQQLMLVCYLLSLGCAPDMVVSLDGFNEMAFAVGNGNRQTHPSYPGIDQWSVVVREHAVGPQALDLLIEFRQHQLDAQALADTTLRYGLTRSCVLGSLASARLGGIRQRWARAQQRYVEHVTEGGTRAATSGPAFRGRPPAAVDAGIRTWSHATETLHAICDGRGIPFVSVLQPNLTDVDGKPMSDTEAGFSASDTWAFAGREGYPKLRAAAARLREQGIHCVDGTRIFVDVTETTYADGSHFNDRGNQLMAEFVAQALLDALPVP